MLLKSKQQGLVVERNGTGVGIGVRVRVKVGDRVEGEMEWK